MAVANTHLEDLCVGGVDVLINDMAKLTLSDADLTVLTAFVTKMDVSTTKIHLDTFISWTSNSEWRE